MPVSPSLSTSFFLHVETNSCMFATRFFLAASRIFIPVPRGATPTTAAFIFRSCVFFNPAKSRFILLTTSSASSILAEDNKFILTLSSSSILRITSHSFSSRFWCARTALLCGNLKLNKLSRSSCIARGLCVKKIIFLSSMSTQFQSTAET